jgi:hypothetical protein
MQEQSELLRPIDQSLLVRVFSQARGRFFRFAGRIPPPTLLNVSPRTLFVVTSFVVPELRLRRAWKGDP